MDDPRDSADALPDSLEREIDALCLEFELAWRSRQTPSIEAYVARVSDVARPAALRDLIAVEADLRRAMGQPVAPEEYRERFPNDASAVDTAFGDLRQTTEVDPAAADVVHPEVTGPPIPDELGRYQVQERLATGAFGEVYLARDQQLDRLVALKVPRRGRFSSEAEVARFVEEARTAAQLNHLAIVTVYDVTRHGDQVCIVQEYVAGQDLASRLRESAFLPGPAAELMIAVAEAVAFAHQRGFIHRDLKPENILLDDGGSPRVADFGLAIHEGVQHLRKGELAGTPVYMSPEQVRGETHRLDGRSDLWSLGVIFYEMLTGRLPFSGETNEQQFDEIKYRDPKPPRQILPDLPFELERICLKCLSKRVTDRYSSGIELADDLRHWLAGDVQEIDREFEARRTRVVPKGLRSFSEEDADFFLELLPGPRDRSGLPESIRFWKTRIEQTDVNRSFAVGLIYGPSGCGKSSLVRAGLLPRLPAHVVTVCVDAAATGTEERLLKTLQRVCPDVPGDISLPTLFQSLREGNWIANGKKTLIVLDQFEQWLHTNGGQPDQPLVQALRHCDGTRVQCVVLVRDEFWLATSRFLRELEIDLVEGANSQLVDLFDPLHARRVLAEFGRAYGRLDENLSALTGDQAAFLDRAVEGLVQDGKVVCIRLALLADMMKGRPWTVASLKQVGGAAGLGVSFLEETFSSPTAPAQHRVHQQAARRVLWALLPESVTDIKGRMRSYEQLREASRYTSRTRDFEDLVRILDGELRLISPTDPEYVSSADQRVETTETTDRYYQLTHDYMVSPLRDWLTRKQKETRRGRTQLRLAERAAAWEAQPDRRHLPSWWECLNILFHIPPRNWTQTQRSMMANAGRYFSLRGLAWVTTCLLLGALAVETYGRFRATELLQSLARVELTKVGTVLDDIVFYRRWTRPRVDGVVGGVSDDPQYRLRLSLARLRLSGERGVIDSLYEQMLQAEPGVFVILRDELAEFRSTLTDRLWRELNDKARPAPRRYRAAGALASYSTADDPRWSPVLDFVAGQMVDAVAADPSSYTSWSVAMQPVRLGLLTPLQSIARHPDRLQTERAFACSLLADYGHDRPELLVELMEMVDDSQVPMVLSQLVPHRAQVIGLLQESIEEWPSSESRETERVKVARGQARAAAALLTLGQSSDRIWRFLRHDADPGRRSHLIHDCARMGVDPGVLTGQLQVETDVSVRRALILSLGEFEPNTLSVELRDSIFAHAAQLFRDDPDAGIHGAAEWLLRVWGAHQTIEPTRPTPSEERTRQARQWYIDGQGHTMAVLSPDTFMMGSPETEWGHFPTEGLHRRRIGRRFAIATKEVTVEQFQRFVDDQKINFRAKTRYARYTEVPDGPQVYVTWYLATQYCNWLSHREGIPPSQWCYRPNANGEYAEGMKPAVGYLSLLGYRLPSAAEWEYACRAGAETSRYYGATEDLLAKYAWYRPNSQDRAHAVGLLKPNDLGLFDMHGNAFEWCHNRVFDYPAGNETVDDGQDLTPIDQTDRMLRGGTFAQESRLIRCAMRYRDPPYAVNATYGLRVAKTVEATGETKHLGDRREKIFGRARLLPSQLGGRFALPDTSRRESAYPPIALK